MNTLKPVLMGLRPSVRNSIYLNTDQAFHATGDNTGNLIFHYAIDAHLGGNLPVAQLVSTTAEVRSKGDMAVIPCANQLGAHVDLSGLANVFGKYDFPMAAIGLGAQSSSFSAFPEVPAGSWQWVREIASRAQNGPNISLRGEFTYRLLETKGLHNNAVVLGCPSLFLSPLKNLGEVISKNATFQPRRVAVSAGIQFAKPLAAIENSLAEIVSQTDGAYICQSAKDMVALGRKDFAAISNEALEQIRLHVRPNLSTEQFMQWAKRYAMSFFDPASWMEYLKGFDFVIGTRIHGTMVGLAMGIPSVCIAHDSRTVELCETMLVPYVKPEHVKDGIRIVDLERLFQFDPVSFDKRRLELARRYHDFLRANSLKPSPMITGLIDQVPVNVRHSNQSVLSTCPDPVVARHQPNTMY